MHPVTRSHPFANRNDFEQMLFEIFHVRKKEDLPFENIEHVYNIFKDSQDYTIADEKERLSNLLILTACLYSVKMKKKVCFISPTYFYAEQAARMRNSYLWAFGKLQEASFSTVVPGMDGYKESVNQSKVVFMHGKDYTEYLPKGWSGRKIIQIFPSVDVPIDPRKVSVCHYDND